VLAALVALNVMLVQLSHQGDSNLARYGFTLMVPRNFLHYFIYPLIGALPPSAGEYTLLKMIVYPIIWVLTLIFGSTKVKKLMLLGYLWIAFSSLPFIPWIKGVEGFLPRICDIPSRYFNIPSMGAAAVISGFVLMLHERFNRIAAYSASIIIVILIGITGIQWTHAKVEPNIQTAETALQLLDIALDSWNGSDTLYISSFGLLDIRIESYNKMYFDGMLVQCAAFSDEIPVGGRLLCGPKSSPQLYVRDIDGWRVIRTFESIESPESTVDEIRR